ncbi:hypothetical protein [Cyclobacterium jeungdonense]|uniref:Uncharacterized protein n=1 Tax=Cyclobacterium jeungdonense TaxID=708087 RepID=A0ABT8C9E8_9BACT|nr:hypothetical protein [Cyclobacterium jeungdonense]MDN3689424.1 hypothetical protein [Cyclobacterium jeungdonense]
MNLKPFRLIVVFFALLFSCESGENENQALKDRVISVHDEVMPEIGNLKSVQNKLREKADSIKLEGAPSASENYGESLEAAAQSCEAAYDGMFVWMRQFKTEYEDMTEEETKAYLEEQLKKVEQVRDDIKTALSVSDSLLNVRI